MKAQKKENPNWHDAMTLIGLELPAPRNAWDHVIDCTCRVIGITMADLKSNSRKAEIVAARKVISNILSINHGLKASQLPLVFGNRDRTMQYHYKTSHEDWMKFNPAYRSIYNEVCDEISKTKIS